MYKFNVYILICYEVQKHIYQPENQVPVELKIMNEGEGVEHIGHGIVTAREVIDRLQEVFDSDYVTRMKFALMDFSNIDKISVEIGELRHIARMVKKASETFQPIIIANVGGPLFFGLSRMWEVFVEPAKLKTRTFRSRKEAEKWINEQLKLPIYS